MSESVVASSCPRLHLPRVELVMVLASVAVAALVARLLIGLFQRIHITNHGFSPIGCSGGKFEQETGKPKHQLET